MESESSKPGKATGQPWSDEVRACRRARRSTAGGFAPTPGALLARAQRSERSATEAICALYYQPIRRFLQRQGARDDEAHDMTQGYFEGVLKYEAFKKVDPELYSFRSWLRTGAKRHLLNVRAHQSIARRLQEEPAQFELRQQLQAAAPEDAERLLRQRRVLEFIDGVWQRLENEYREAGESDLFEHLQKSIRGEATELADAELCRKLGKSKDFVGVRRHRLRTREFPDALRAMIHDLEPPDGPPRTSDREAILALLHALV